MYGTVRSDGLTVVKDSATSTIGSDLINFGGTDYYSAEVELKDSSNRTVVLRSPSGIANARVGTTTNHQFEVITSDTLRASVGTGGDISFYEDTGVTAKFFWDASAESLGIGTTSPTGGATTVVDVYGSSSSAINFHNATSGTTATDGGVVGQYGNDLVLFNYEAGIIQLGTNNTERMRIDSSGRVGIATDSPVSKLDIAWGGYQTSGYALTVGADIGNNSTRTNNTIKYGVVSGVNYSNSEKQVELLTHTSNSVSNTLSLGGAGNTALTSPTEILFLTSSTQNGAGGTERMRIDSSGNLKFNSGYGSAATAYGVRAWVHFGGSSATIGGDGNVSSITDNGTGDFTINFSTAMPDVHYSATVTTASQPAVTSYHLDRIQNYTTTSIKLEIVNATNISQNADPGDVSVTVVR